jgi:hypothetical protein
MLMEVDVPQFFDRRVVNLVAQQARLFILLRRPPADQAAPTVKLMNRDQ